MTTPGGQLTPGDEPEIGDPPQYGVPSGAYVGDAGSPQSFKDLNTLNKDEAKRRMRQPLEGMFGRQRESVWGNGGLLGHIADLLFGPGPAGPAQRLSDGMTELNQRLDLMDDVSGYGAMIMTNSHRFTGNAYKTIPFNMEYGPSTPWSVTVDTAGNRFVLKAGTWSVNLLIAVPQAGALGGPTWMRPAITVYRANGTEYLNQWLDFRSGENPHSFFAQIPLVIPDDSGFYVQARFSQSSINYRVLGGTDRSKFWVNRWDMRTDNNNMIINPPDGPDI